MVMAGANSSACPDNGACVLRIMSVMMFVVVVGCGEPPDAITQPCPPDMCPSAPEDMGGVWSGDMVLDVSEANPILYRVDALSVVVYEGGDVAVTGLCPDGSGQIMAHAVDGGAAWGGIIECPLPRSSCPGFVLRYTRASLKMSSPEALEIDVAGDVEGGCGTNVVTGVMTGSRRPTPIGHQVP